ncbi:MAG: helix-turn-helix domain-containing protein [Ruminococcaceae bacterium]|nr:helix-turn-helix domain-containing protein [Oscillospiraceae bacterium]
MIAKYEKRTLSETVHVSVHKYQNLHNLPHWHMEHELVFVESGTLELMRDNELFLLSDGVCAFIRSEEIHYLKSITPSIVKVIKIDAKYVKHIVGDSSLENLLSGDKYNLKNTVNEIYKELKHPQKFSNLIADSMVIRLIADIFRNENTCQKNLENTKSSSKYKELLEIISNNYSDITFEDAARFMCFSKPYFSKYFYKLSGVTFTQYINTLKISAAVRLISEGELTITEISEKCGFNTIRNFNRVFKEYTGYTPKALPNNYTFTYSLKDSFDSGFDPTLTSSQIIE